MELSSEYKEVTKHFRDCARHTARESHQFNVILLSCSYIWMHVIFGEQYTAFGSRRRTLSSIFTSASLKKTFFSKLDIYLEQREEIVAYAERCSLSSERTDGFETPFYPR